MTDLNKEFPEYGPHVGFADAPKPMDPEPTLWDYYAMAALQGALAGGRGTDSVYANCEFDDCETASDEFAAIAAHAADAMMKVRQKISK